MTPEWTYNRKRLWSTFFLLVSICNTNGVCYRRIFETNRTRIVINVAVFGLCLTVRILLHGLEMSEPWSILPDSIPHRLKMA